MMFVHYFILPLAMCSFIEASGISKRYLLFPRQAPTRHQFIAGIGIPVDLEYESLTVGYVLKAMFHLPWNVTTFKQNPFIPEFQTYLHTAKELQHKISRWSVYASIESVIGNYGYNGRECLLRAICEANLKKFSKRVSIIGELLHILLTPSTSFEQHEANKNDYFAAEQSGKSGQCDSFDCAFSVLKHLSVIL